MIVDANLEERDPALLAQGERDYDIMKFHSDVFLLKVSAKSVHTPV
jgi:hypothetical protein